MNEASNTDRSLDAQALGDRVETLSWGQITKALDGAGCAHIPAFLNPTECRAMARLYDEEQKFRSTVIMKRHGFGSGEYRYFKYQLPGPVQAMRAAFYARLSTIANDWHERMRFAFRFPADHNDYLDICHAAGQTRPTPLILTYGPGDYNCLHQDLYGEQVFPLQVAILLSEPGVDFTGGEFVLTEQRPRMQSRPHVPPLRQGSGLIFAVNDRPVQGKKGFYRVKQRHGVSVVRSGQRRTLGLIFHDAR